MTSEATKISILIVDARADEARLAGELLGNAFPKAKIVRAATALEFAQAYAELSEISVAILDRDLDWAGSPELLESLARRHPECRRILFSHREPSDAAALALPVDARLAKTAAGYLALPAEVRRLLAAESTRDRSARPAEVFWSRTPRALFTLDRGGGIVAANPAARRSLPATFGNRPAREGAVPEEQPARASILDLLPGPAASARVARALAGGDPVLNATLGEAGSLRTTGSPAAESLWIWPLEGPGPADGAVFAGTLIEAPPDARTPAPGALAGAPGEPSPERDAPLIAALSTEATETTQLLAQYAKSLARLTGEERERVLARIDELSARLQTFSRGIGSLISSNERARQPTGAVDLDEVARQALAALAPRIDATEAEIELGALPKVTGDERLLRMLLTALLDNALKFRGSAPPKIEIGAEPRANDWLIRIEDHGIGVPPGTEERAFDAFERLHDPDEFPGLGTGLTLCRYIAALHGGGIWLEPGTSEDGGTVVRISLPNAERSEHSRLATEVTSQ